MNCLVETALLTHGLRSITNEELAQSWHCPDAILAWVDGGKLKLGPIGEYLPFRERSEELIRIDCDHLEEALQTGASGALTASGTMAVCRRLDIPMAITCGMGGIGDLRGEELCPDLPALMNIPVALISTSPKDMLDRPATLDWLRRHGVHTAGEPCTGYLFCGEPVALELPLSSCNNEAAVRRLTANGGLLLLNPIPEKERVRPAVLIDVGYHQTEISVVENTALTAISTLPIGGYQFASDLSFGLDVPMDAAEQAKRRYVFSLDLQEKSEVLRTAAGSKKVSRSAISYIIEARATELAGMLRREMENMGVNLDARPAVYVSGGGLLMMRGGLDFMRKALNLPLKRDMPWTPRLSSPNYCSAFGALDFVLKANRPQEDTTASGSEEKLGSLLKKIKEFFMK